MSMSGSSIPQQYHEPLSFKASKVNGIHCLLNSKSLSKFKLSLRTPSASFFIPYGGSVKTRSAFCPFINKSIVRASVESPHISLCFPSCHISPSLARSCMFSLSSSKLSSTTSGSSFFSSSNPKSDISKSSSSSVSSASSFSSASKSHCASSPTLLSASLNAFIFSSLKSSAIMTGTLSSPSLLAAFSLVCPATIILFLSITIGTLKPKFFILSATAATASSLSRGLF